MEHASDPRPGVVERLRAVPQRPQPPRRDPGSAGEADTAGAAGRSGVAGVLAPLRPSPGGDEQAPAPTLRSAAKGLLVAARPRQWLKNLLVFAVPAAAGSLARPGVFADALLAFVVFTLAAAGTYLLNDVADRDADALHPHKRHRPIASGAVPVRLATGAGALSLLAAISLAGTVGTTALALVAAAYVATTAVYTLWAKHEPLLDVLTVASGFVLRAGAGAAATGIAVSEWFLIVVSFGAFYVVVSKRHAELVSAGTDRSRPALGSYSLELLREMRFTSAAVTMVAYALWAFGRADAVDGGVLFQLSVLPFVVAMYRYAMDVDRGLGEEPEEIVFRDRVLQVVCGAWAAVFLAAVGVG